jgi:hypothetical protein
LPAAAKEGDHDVLFRTPKLGLAMLLMVVSAIAACSSGVTASPSQTVCDGISSDVGGCTTERHEFTGTTCEGLAKEWAVALDGKIVGILNGPGSVGELGRSVRIRQALILTTTDMNTRLTELGLQADCDLPEFMAAAEPMFSGALKAGVGDALYDGKPPATYEEWLQDVSHVVRMIDEGE